MMRFLLIPYWFVSIFTTAKSFRDNPIIGSRTANRMGLHKNRVRLAHFLVRMRRTFLRRALSKELRQEFDQNGIVVIENFLSDEDFERLKHAVRTFQGDLWAERQGDTVTLRRILRDHVDSNVQAFSKLLNNASLNQLFQYCSASAQRPVFHLELVRHGVGDTAVADPQKTLHADTFHPTTKGWLYLQDVDESSGPLVYVKGSNRLSKERLEHEHHVSMKRGSERDVLSQRGSVRLREGPEPAKFEVQARPVIVRANTLVVADTFGFHCRGSASKGATRLAIFMSIRTNPFMPWPGLGLKIFHRLKCNILVARMNRREARSGSGTNMWRERAFEAIAMEPNREGE